MMRCVSDSQMIVRLRPRIVPLYLVGNLEVCTNFGHQDDVLLGHFWIDEFNDLMNDIDSMFLIKKREELAMGNASSSLGTTNHHRLILGRRRFHLQRFYVLLTI